MHYFKSNFNIYQNFQILTIQRPIRYKENGYQNKSKARLAAESPRYRLYCNVQVMCRTNFVLQFQNTTMHLCNTNFLPSFSDFELVNAHHTIDLYMNLQLLKGHFSQQMAIAKANNIVEPGDLRDRNKQSLTFAVCPRRTMPI